MILDNGLVTPRLILRTLEAGDARGPYLAWMNDPEVLRYTESRFANHDRGSIELFIRTMNDSSDNLLLGLFCRESKDHIGNIKLGPIDRHHERAFIGVIVGDKTRWRQGFASEAIEAVVAHAQTGLGLQRLAAGIYASNVGSLRAFRKAGFREVARLPRWSHCDGEAVDDVVVMWGAAV